MDLSLRSRLADRSRCANLKMLLCQQLFQKIQRPWIMALAQPKNRLFTYSRVLIGFSELNQEGNSLAIMHLAQRKDCLLLYLGVRIVLNGISNLRSFFFAANLRQPENGLSADMRALVVTRHINEIFQCLGVFALRESKGALCAHIVI